LAAVKRVLFALVTLLGGGVASATICESQVVCEGDAIYGQWKWYKYIHKDQEFPPNNPDLNLIFEFSPGGKNRLYWDRKGERGFCERYGDYSFSQCQLTDQVTWVNPDNARSCSSDPDMQIGRLAQTRAEVCGNELYLYVGGGENTLIYIWKKQN